MGGEVCTDFRYSNNWNILISSSAIEFWLILGVPPGGGGGCLWVGVVRGCPPHTCTCTCMHACTHMHMRIWHHREFPGIPPVGVAICIKIIMFTMHACVCVHVCACMCTCVGGTPHCHPTTPTPIHPPPTPRAKGSQKHQNSITLELIEIIRFCLKILYLWTFLNSYRL